jgi:hypothetical protein
VDTWVYDGNRAAMTALAANLHKTRADTVISGTVRYKGTYADVLDLGVGHRLSFASVCGATGDESLQVPVRAVTVKLNWQGGGLLATTEMACSSRRDPRTSEGMYMHLSQFGSGYNTGGMGGNGGENGGYAGGMGGQQGGYAGGDGGDGGGYTGGMGGDGGGMGDPGHYQKNYRHSSKSLGEQSSTPESRKASAEQHQADLEATRNMGTAKGLLADATSGDAGAAAKQAGEDKAAQHQQDLAAAHRHSEQVKAKHDADLEAARARSKQLGDTTDLLDEAKGGS